MANQTSPQELVGTFIEAWAGDFIEPFSQEVPLLSSMPFREGERQGGLFHYAMRGTTESGTTFAAVNTTPGEATRPYVGARSGEAPDWQIEAPSIHGRSRVVYEAIAKSMANINSEGTDKRKAVRAATKIVAEGLMLGQLKKAEALLLHGRRGLGQIEGISSVAAASTTPGADDANNFDGAPAGFVVDVQVSAPTWAEAIFVQCEGGTFDLFSNTAGLPVTKLNTVANTVLTSGANQTGYILIGVTPTTPLAGVGITAPQRVLRLFHSAGTAGGTGTGILGGATFVNMSTAHICYESGGPATEWVSLTSMARNTGTLFGVSGAKYRIARGNIQDNVGNLKLADLVRYVARPINLGAAGKTMRAIVPTELFAQFANDESTLRRYAAVTGDAETGFDNIQLYLPHKGKLEILGHNLQKAGEVLIDVPLQNLRIGAQDFDFIRRGGGRNTDSLVLEVAQSPASEMRTYAQFAPLCEVPAHMMSLTGVTY